MSDAVPTLFAPASRPTGVGVVAALVQALALRRSRRQLAGLDEHRLRDVGLTREEALAQAGRRAWDPPEYWLRGARAATWFEPFAVSGSERSARRRP